MLWIPEENDPIWKQIKRHRLLYSDGKFSKYKIEMYKKLNLFYLIYYNYTLLKTISKLNKLRNTYNCVNDIPLKNYRWIASLKDGCKKGNLYYRTIINYTKFIGFDKLFDIQDRVKIAHNKLIDFITYYKINTKIPSVYTKDETEKKWGRYFTGIKGKYHFSNREVYLDKWMIAQLKKAGITLNITHTDISHKKCKNFINYCLKNKIIPSIHSKNIEERKWGSYYSSLLQTYKKQGTYHRHIDETMIQMLKKSFIWERFEPTQKHARNKRRKSA